MQLVLLLLALAVVADGLLGARTDPTQLATVLTWVHYRGLLVIALLAAGNLFCAGCPFVLVRDAGRRIRPPRLAFPRWLRTKWIGVALFVAVLFCYELFDLWALPRATAYLVLAYFASALVVDTVFTGASFCKYLCPIGQFNFVASTMSPLELRVKDAGTCRTCRTADCIKGRRAPEAPDVVLARGCELRLFLPSKVGNMDCTLCLDCVHACPHDNIALAGTRAGRRAGRQRPAIRDRTVRAAPGHRGARRGVHLRQPAERVRHDRRRSRRRGVVVERARGRLGSAGARRAVRRGAARRAVRCCLAPRRLRARALAADRQRSVAQIAVNFSYALVPFGFGMWLAHYGFHLLTGALVIVPVTQRAVADRVRLGRCWAIRCGR